MMIKIKIGIFLSLVLAISCVFGASQTSITRDISGFQQAGQEFEVFLNLTVQKDITGLGIVDFFPAGSTVSSCSEPYYRIVNNSIEILVFNENEDLSNQTISYNITVFNSGTFNGTWASTISSLSGNIPLQNLTFEAPVEICGDLICNNGESCSTCSGDCGACPPPQTSGGSSGGGSSKKKSSTKVDTSNLTTSKISEPLETKDDPELLDEKIELNEESNRGFFGFTGNSILGVFSEENTGKVGFSLLLLGVIIAGILLLIKKKNYIQNKIYRLNSY